MSTAFTIAITALIGAFILALILMAAEVRKCNKRVRTIAQEQLRLIEKYLRLRQAVRENDLEYLARVRIAHKMDIDREAAEWAGDSNHSPTNGITADGFLVPSDWEKINSKMSNLQQNPQK